VFEQAGTRPAEGVCSHHDQLIYRHYHTDSNSASFSYTLPHRYTATDPITHTYTATSAAKNPYADSHTQRARARYDATPA